MGDVYYAEVAIFRYICRNADALLSVAEGELTSCDVDQGAYQRLAARLMAS